MLELRNRKAFGEDVGLLFLGVDVLGNDPFLLADLRPKEVILQSEILVARGHFGHIHKRQTTLVVLKHSGPDKTGL